MSARDLAALLLLGGPVPAIGLAAPIGFIRAAAQPAVEAVPTAQPAATNAVASPAGASEEVDDEEMPLSNRLSPDAAARVRSRFSGGTVSDARADGAERAYKAAVSAAAEIFLELDPEHTGSISVRQMLVAFNPPSSELRIAVEKVGLELVE